MIKIFISYSHVDDNYRNELQKHLTSLQHQSIVETWHDRRIISGEEWAEKINNELRTADIILLLVSSDFISSSYCYDLEMTEALARHNRKEAVVIPIILRPCHWTGLPFGKLQAATKEGKPVEKYPSLDDAFLEITKNIETVAKRLTAQIHKSTEKTSSTTANTFGNMGISTSVRNRQELPRSSNLAIPKDFSDHDKDTFIASAFDYMTLFFEGSLKELKNRNPGTETHFQKIDSRSFEATIYINGKQVSKCGIWLGDFMGSRGFSSIMYNNSGLGQGNGFNESFSIKDNGNILSLEPMGMYHSHQTEKLLTNEGAAEYYWTIFFDPVKMQHQ